MKPFNLFVDMMFEHENSIQAQYISPVIEVFEIHGEGVLCMSGGGVNDSLYEDDEWSDLWDR